MENEIEKNSAYFLGLREIAAWQLESPMVVQIEPISNGSERPIFAELPALQRGAVWSAFQTESLWDSLTRGFPVGSFFFAPYQDGFGRGDFKLGTGNFGRADFLLLDGQQRATAIALGFLDIWSESGKYVDGPALWVDLAPAKSGDQDFVFRLLTRSHPWGYDRDDSKKRLAQGDIRDALKCFRDVGRIQESAAKLPLSHAWPWDAECPVPVALLLASVGAADPYAELSRRLRALPICCNEAKLKGGGNLADMWNTEAATFKRGSKDSPLERLMTALRRQLALKRIPALVLPSDEAATDHNPGANNARRDAVETLFVRVNSAGTPLAGEELIYSSLKAAWPEAPFELKNLQPKKLHIVTPARLVSLLWRLHSAFPDDGNEVHNVLPGIPSVSDFRKAMRDTQKHGAFKNFVRNPQHKGIIVELMNWVRLDFQAPESNAKSDSNEAWRLPPTLAAQLFAGDRGLDLLFIVVAWIKCLQRDGSALAELTALQRQRSLGFIVALHWFAERPSECVSRLWQQLGDCDDLCDFFNAVRFRSLLPTRADGSRVMLPLIPPDVLDSVIRRRVAHSGNSFPIFDNEFWHSGSRWEHFYGRLSPKFQFLDEDLRDWLTKSDFAHGDLKHSEATVGGGDPGAIERGETLRQGWDFFLNKIWGHRPLVDYSQREWLTRWFPDFDPTLPGQMEDLNRPWDYDHIHPSSHIVKQVPAVIREWHQSIGNLRAWPLELNRGDQADSPEKKLALIDAQSNYFVNNRSEEIRRASFISEPAEWANWQASVPKPQENNQYLKMPGFDGPRHALLLAITDRFCRLYREWYENLALGDLNISKE